MDEKARFASTSASISEVDSRSLLSSRRPQSFGDWHAPSKLRVDGDAIADADIRRLSPLVHEHLNFLGRYHFSLSGDVRGGELRELRDPNAGLEQSGCSRAEALSVHSRSITTQTPNQPTLHRS